MSWNSGNMSTDNTYIKYRIEITENSTDQTLNTSNVTVKVFFWRTNTGYETYGSGTVYCTIDGTKYSASVKSTQKITNNGIYLFSKTLNIAHDSDGSKELTCSAYINHSRFTSNNQSFTVNLTLIPRCSKLSAPSVELGNEMTITITRDDDTFVDQIYWECGTELGLLVEGYSSATLTWTPSIELARQYPNVENVPIYLYCRTYNTDGEFLGESVITVQCTVPAQYIPTIAVEIGDSSGSFDEYQCFLQGFSTMSVHISAVGQLGSTIVSYTSIIDSKTYTGAEFTTEVINTSGTITAQITVRDSRGRIASLDYEFEVVPYSVPNVTSLTAIRCDENGNEYYQGQYCKLTFSAEITSLDGLNSASYRVEYKKQDESSFSSLSASDYEGQAYVSNGTVMFAAENGSSYNVYLYAVDDFGESSKYVFSPSVFRLMHFGADGQSIAFFKRCEGDVPGDFGQPIRLSGGYVPAPADSVVSLNDLTNPGCYVSTGLSVDNAPFSGDYCIEVRWLADDGTFLMQKADQYGESGLVTVARYRQDEDGTVDWTAWEEMYDFAPSSHRHAAEDIVQDDDEATALINAMKTVLIDTIYPVGSIYMSVNSTSPTTLFGGSWTQIQDRFILAAGSTYAGGATGGAASHTHVVPVGYNTSNKLWGISYYYGSQNVSTSGSLAHPNQSVSTMSGSFTWKLPSTGGTSNLPPYIAVYVWKRTA